MITGNECGPNFLTFVLQLWENPEKNLNQEIDQTGDRTAELLNQRQTCYHLSQRGEQKIPKVNKQISESIWDHNLLIMESYIEISPVALELLPKKQANEQSDNLLEFYKHDLFFCCNVIKSADRRPKMFCYQLKFLSN